MRIAVIRHRVWRHRHRRRRLAHSISAGSRGDIDVVGAGGGEHRVLGIVRAGHRGGGGQADIQRAAGRAAALRESRGAAPGGVVAGNFKIAVGPRGRDARRQAGARNADAGGTRSRAVGRGQRGQRAAGADAGHIQIQFAGHHLQRGRGPADHAAAVDRQRAGHARHRGRAALGDELVSARRQLRGGRHRHRLAVQVQVAARAGQRQRSGRAAAVSGELQGSGRATQRQIFTGTHRDGAGGISSRGAGLQGLAGTQRQSRGGGGHIESGTAGYGDVWRVGQRAAAAQRQGAGADGGGALVTVRAGEGERVAAGVEGQGDGLQGAAVAARDAPAKGAAAAHRQRVRARVSVSLSNCPAPIERADRLAGAVQIPRAARVRRHIAARRQGREARHRQRARAVDDDSTGAGLVCGDGQRAGVHRERAFEVPGCIQRDADRIVFRQIIQHAGGGRKFAAHGDGTRAGVVHINRGAKSGDGVQTADCARARFVDDDIGTTAQSQGKSAVLECAAGQGERAVDGRGLAQGNAGAVVDLQVVDRRGQAGAGDLRRGAIEGVVGGGVQCHQAGAIVIKVIQRAIRRGGSDRPKPSRVRGDERAAGVHGKKAFMTTRTGVAINQNRAHLEGAAHGYAGRGATVEFEFGTHARGVQRHPGIHCDIYFVTGNVPRAGPGETCAGVGGKFNDTTTVKSGSGEKSPVLNKISTEQ